MGLTNQDRTRLQAAKFVSTLMFDPDFANLFTVTDDDGRLPVVTALEQDSVHFVTKLARRVGGRATLIAFGRSDADSSLRVGVANLHADISTGYGDDWHLPVGATCTVGDLFRILTPGASVSFRLAEDELKIMSVFEAPAPEGAGDLVDL